MRISLQILSYSLCLAASLFCPQLSYGQTQNGAQATLAQAGSMPSWTIPVLRLVSATHVEPTTGVVITDSGLILIPADFASPGDEIIVLDGGTDILRHGRPAKIVQRFPEHGLQIISAETLKRRGAAFSSSRLAQGHQIRLVAFPPAEMIAEGEPPLNIETSLGMVQENGRDSITVLTPLPNVSGALVDKCGNLAGYSSADGVQSMSTSEAPQYRWQQDLEQILSEMQLEPRIVDCTNRTEPEPIEAPPEPEPEPEAEPEAEPEDEQPAEPEPDPEPEASEEPPADEPETEESEEAIGDEATPDEAGLEEIVLLPPEEDEATQTTQADETVAIDDVEEDSGLPVWLWLLAAVLLFAAAFIIHRTRSGAAMEPVAEPGLIPSPANDGDGDAKEADESAFISDGLDMLLTITGQMGDGTPLSSSCAVSGHAINLVIGRGHEDININSTTVSRRHASLNGTRDMLTISDLGSSNGTSINGVPCLEGETLFVQQEDVIILGDCRFSFQITPQQQASE